MTGKAIEAKRNGWAEVFLKRSSERERPAPILTPNREYLDITSAAKTVVKDVQATNNAEQDAERDRAEWEDYHNRVIRDTRLPNTELGMDGGNMGEI